VDVDGRTRQGLELVGQPEVIQVLVGEEDEAHGLRRVAQARQAFHQSPERLRPVHAGVDERQLAVAQLSVSV